MATKLTTQENKDRPAEMPRQVGEVPPIVERPETKEKEAAQPPEAAEAARETERPPAVPGEPLQQIGAAPLVSRIPRDEVMLSIEKILSEDLEATYVTMDPRMQREFKKRGEETAAKIRKLVRAAKIHAKKIVKLITEWLRLIPHVNKFFLEQEAKIKTDKILAMAARKKDKGVL